MGLEDMTTTTRTTTQASDHTTTQATTTTHDHTQAHARARGEQDGLERAEMYRDEVTHPASAKEWLDAYETGTLGDVWELPAPLSGEWAGESLSELGMGTWDEWTLDAYESAYMQAYIARMLDMAQAVLHGDR